ncbi:lanthionine synthetase LanC family protein [Pectobacterium cacticida]|uniref:lanthionine synthetase LanC family protein n=1 Tax=Pectobacterium cacticida TaxID=69221 RepID=UPI002FEEEDB9
MKNVQYLNAAESIGKHLQRECFCFDNRSNWQGSIVDAINGQFQVVTRTFDASLYNGLSGIALFLAELYRQKPDPILFETLTSTINSIQHMLEQPHQLNVFSLHAGQLGVAWAMWRIGTILDRPDWKAQGLNLLQHIHALPIPDNELDVIGGAAGAIPALLKIYQAEDDDRWLACAVRLGDFLLSKAKKTPTTYFWVTSGNERGLTGYSHGAAGFGLALIELGVITRRDIYLNAGLQAFNYERENFNPQHQNWPDLRSIYRTPQFNTMWCHGAPGVALSRLRAWQLLNEPTLLQEALVGLTTTSQQLLQQLSTHPEQINFSLCHGGAGNSEILLMGAACLQRADFAELAHQVASLGIQTYQLTQTPWPSGVFDPSGVGEPGKETPGLMLGLAGTGLYYLRLFDPERVETVLHIH